MLLIFNERDCDLYKRHIFRCAVSVASNLVHLCDVRWNQIESSILSMYDKLVAQGFTYYNGKITVVESDEEQTNV